MQLHREIIWLGRLGQRIIMFRSRICNCLKYTSCLLATTEKTLNPPELFRTNIQKSSAEKFERLTSLIAPFDYRLTSKYSELHPSIFGQEYERAYHQWKSKAVVEQQNALSYAGRVRLQRPDYFVICRVTGEGLHPSLVVAFI
jgi:hypothetical protein